MMYRTDRFDVAVVGAGIVGLAHAYHLARAGRSVVVLERSPLAQGASVRNFGMIWPIGQPPGERLALALRSRQIWLDVLGQAGIWHDRAGSLHMAYREDEAAVLSEFATAAKQRGYGAELLEPKQVRELSPRVRAANLRCALYSSTEVGVDPRVTIARLADWLAQTLGVQFRFGCLARSYEGGTVTTSLGPIGADRLIVCSGTDLQTLYPEVLGHAGLSLCKLQMMRAEIAGRSVAFGPMLAAGLTLRHYPAFRDCPSLPALCERLDRELPEYGAAGIHVLVSRNREGAFTLGDSHEYDDAVEPFDKPHIDELVLHYLDTFFDCDGLTITGRWQGHYVKHPTEPYLVTQPASGVVAVTGLGGAGMTLSFGLAERVVHSLEDHSAGGGRTGRQDDPSTMTPRRDRSGNL
jgi:FAD dependent oxidoreductase TIGR03364